jgi:hypothetical protein
MCNNIYWKQNASEHPRRKAMGGNTLIKDAITSCVESKWIETASVAAAMDVYISDTTNLCR